MSMRSAAYNGCDTWAIRLLVGPGPHNKECALDIFVRLMQSLGKGHIPGVYTRCITAGPYLLTRLRSTLRDDERQEF